MGDVLTFVTRSDEEPVLEYEIHPSIYFTVAAEGNILPTANVCINKRVDDITQKFPDNLLTICLSLTMPLLMHTTEIFKSEKTHSF